MRCWSEAKSNARCKLFRTREPDISSIAGARTSVSSSTAFLMPLKRVTRCRSLSHKTSLYSVVERVPTGSVHSSGVERVLAGGLYRTGCNIIQAQILSLPRMMAVSSKYFLSFTILCGSSAPGIARLWFPRVRKRETHIINVALNLTVQYVLS